MPDYCLFFEDLSPNESLRLLAEAVATDAAIALPALQVEVNRGAFGVAVTLMIPEKHKQNIVEARQYQQAVVGLTRRYQAMKAAEPRRMAARAEGLPPAKGLTWLLLHCEPVPTPTETREFLLVGHGLNADRAAQVFEDLRFHATSVRLSAADSQGGQRYFFHALDDPARHSSLAAALAGEAFADLNLLHCRETTTLKLFLPPEADPDTAALSHFSQILGAVPSLLDVPGPLIDEGLFVAIDPNQRGASLDETTRTVYDILYLGSLTFHGEAHFSRQASREIAFDIPKLESSREALSRLRHAIADGKQHVGYRLELRPTQHREPIDQERARLYERQAEIDYKLAYLDSISRAKPQLLRFTQKQLPALAAMVRALPQQVLRQGFPRYAFQALENDPAGGYHYLFVDPREVVLTDLDPLPAWQTSEDPPMRFWLDPFWARYYHDDLNQCLVFVPQNSALFPTLHGWETATMDGYMRDLVEAWFKGHTGTVPQAPLYVFDGAFGEGTSAGERPLKLAVLDAAAFGPLNLQLGWINDHLVIADAIGLQPFIEKMADASTIAHLADQLARNAATYEAEFDRLLMDTNHKIANKLGELTAIVTRELNKVVSETHHTTERIKEAFSYLHQLDTVREEAGSTSEEAFKLLRRTEGTNKELHRFLEQLNRDVEREIQDAYKLRRGIIGKVTATIRELSTTHDELREKLYQILRLPRR